MNRHKRHKELQKILNKKFLIKEYINNKKSTIQIAKKINCNTTTINKYLLIYGIKIRTISEANKGHKVSLKTRRKIKKHNVKYWLGKKRSKTTVKKISKAMENKRSRNYKDGRYLKTYCCIDCNIEISINSGVYGQGRCGSCAMKHLWRDKKFRHDMSKKMSKVRKGKIPKNLFTNINKSNSPRELMLFKLVKKYFSNPKRNYFVKTKQTKRFLDVAIPNLKLDFEYNGKLHLMKANIIRDKQRTKELKMLGWEIINFDRNNFHLAEDIIKNIKRRK